MENAVKSNRMDIRNFQGYKFVCPDKLYPKETCDVRSQYSSTVPFSSNENCQLDGQPELNGLHILAVDKISIRKGLRCLTVVLDYLSGRILFCRKRSQGQNVKTAFQQLKRRPAKGHQRQSIQFSWSSLLYTENLPGFLQLIGRRTKKNDPFY